MKRIVVFQSGTGFTQKYAKWIAEALSCEAKPIKEVKEQELETYDVVIYGGWIMGNMIMGYDKIQKMNLKKVVVFAVGASLCNENTIQNIQKANPLENRAFFYFIGGIDQKKLGFMKRSILKMVRKSIEKKENPTEDEQYMLQVLGTTADYSDKNLIKPLVECCL